MNPIKSAFSIPKKYKITALVVGGLEVGGLAVLYGFWYRSNSDEGFRHYMNNKYTSALEYIKHSIDLTDVIAKIEAPSTVPRTDVAPKVEKLSILTRLFGTDEEFEERKRNRFVKTNSHSSNNNNQNPTSKE